MIDKIYTITKEAVVELQEKMKAWVRAVLPKNTSELENDSGFIDSATFTAIYNTTPFADIKEAVDNGYCVKCDVSGYTYELVQALSDKITFALTNNVNGTIVQETIWVTSNDEWEGEGVNVASKSYVDTMLGNIEALLEAI